MIRNMLHIIWRRSKFELVSLSTVVGYHNETLGSMLTYCPGFITGTDAPSYNRHPEPWAENRFREACFIRTYSCLVLQTVT